jgi:hypothetical protein
MIDVKQANLRMNQGSRFEVGIDVIENGAAKNLTGYTARMQIRASKESTTVLADYTTANGALSVNALAGRVTIVVLSTTTDAYTWGDAVYDLEIVDGANDATRILEGKISLNKQVTR